MLNLDARKKLATDIEQKYRSSGVCNSRKKGRICRVSIGVVNPDITRYLFVLKNPGLKRGESEQLGSKEELIKHIDQNSYPTMAEYLEGSDRLARKEQTFIDGFISVMNVNRDFFGTINLSIFHSHKVNDIGSDFYLEIEASRTLSYAETELPLLHGMIMCGIDLSLFCFAYGSELLQIDEIEFYDYSPPKIRTIRAKMFSDLMVPCVFIPHLCYPKLTNDDIRRYGKETAEIFKC